MKADEEIESSILARLESLNRAFISQDGEQVLNLFATDPDVTFLASEAGETAVGPNDLKLLLNELFSRPEAYSWKWLEVSVSGSETVAWAAADTVIQVHKGTSIREYPYRLTTVFEKRGSEWLLMHFHGSEPVNQEENDD